MNGIERHLSMLHKHTKNITLSLSFISLLILFAISSVALIANAQEYTDEAGCADAGGEWVVTDSIDPETEISTISYTCYFAEADTKAQVEQNERQAEAQERAQEKRAALTMRAQERVTNLAANISNRMDAAATRFGQIIDRLNSRITKLSAQGVDTTEAAGHVADAQAHLDAATTVLADIDTTIAAVTSSENPREAWVTAKSTYQGARASLHAAQQSLRAAVAALKLAVQTSATNTGVSDAVQNDNADANEEATSTTIDESN